jgi:uncharacterized membrane protein YfcA
LSGPVLAGAIAITVLAASCQSLTGFGFALVMVPLLSLIWDVKSAVVMSTTLGTIMLVPLLLEVRRHVSVGIAGRLLLGSLVGIPLGVVVLDRIDPEALKVLVGAVVIIASLLLYFAPQVRWPDAGGSTAVVVGAISGMLRGSTSMGGPPSVIYLLGVERHMETFRGTLLAFFLPASVITVVVLAAAGKVTPEILRTSAIGLPALVAGLFLGGWVRSWMPESVFRAVVLGVLIATSIAVIVSASGSMT